MSLLSNHLTCLYGDADPANRGDISNITATLVLRLRRGSTIHAKASADLNLTREQREEHECELKHHWKFLDVFVDFLEEELGPTCSFPRHISALKALQSLMRSGVDPLIGAAIPARPNQEKAAWPFKKWLCYPSMREALWLLVLDPFEEVRTSACLLLEQIFQASNSPANLYQDTVSNDRVLVTSASNVYSGLSETRKNVGWSQEEKFSRYAEEADRLAALTTRADHADGVGQVLRLQYLFSSRRLLILSDVQERLCKALGLVNGEIELPCKEFSLHGYLVGLRYIIDGCGMNKSSNQGMVLGETGVTVRRVLELCQRVWHAVRDDLCVDSPESSREIDLIGPFEGPKDFLAYSWRALRDSSLVMQAILQQLESCLDKTELQESRVQHIRTVYGLCFEQLTVLRHRGAFSTVAQTFAICCEQSARVANLQPEFKLRFQVRKRAGR